MAHSLRTHKTPDGRWTGSVNTKAYGAGYAVHTTAPFADRGDAYKAAEAWRSEQTAKNKAAKAAKESAHMHCQCCGRAHLANTGVMAHHGYQRPGGGWQTASCYGARHLPFEVSRDTLGQMIVALKAHRDRLRTTRQEMADERHPLTLSYDDHAQPKVWSHLRKRNVHPEVTVMFTRATFGEQVEAHKAGLTRYGRNPGTFDELKAKDLASRDRQIKRVREDISTSQKRFDGWVHTHEWDATAKVWAPLAKAEG